MEKEYIAGYISQGIRDLILSHGKKSAGLTTSRNLSYFYCENAFINNGNKEIENPIFSVLENILIRGIPTIPSIYTEEILSDKIGLTKKEVDSNGNITFHLKSEEAAKKWMNCLLIGDPRQETVNKKESLDLINAHGKSSSEKEFYLKTINSICKGMNQLLQPQVELRSFLDETNHTYGQRVDFLLESPDAKGELKGLVIEIDGEQHGDFVQMNKDEERDNEIRKEQYEVIRLKANGLNSFLAEDKLKEYLNRRYFEIFKKNMAEPTFNDKEGIDYLQIYLSPFGIDRVQESIIKAFKTEMIDINAEKIRIAAVERDVPCVDLAIKDLLVQIKHLSILQNGKSLKIPDFAVDIYVSEEFKDAKLNKGNEVRIFDKTTDFSGYDVVIDVSVMNYRTFLPSDLKCDRQKLIAIRSIHHPFKKRKINFIKFNQYDNITIDENSESVASLRFFLQSIFRKNEFREKQIEIIESALKGKNPIALLPTGAGKSLTYQLAGLLKAGLVIVVDPLKSLMKDQTENLLMSSIDTAVYINSSLDPKEKKIREEAFVRGEYQFAFIAPERFQADEFRNFLRQAGTEGSIFSFGVIDEAHCVSEWGHDFRTSYLKLGDNFRNLCNANLDEKLTILGLTGTASFDVLSDVQREVGIQEKSRIVRPEALRRDELKFKIIEVKAKFSLNATEWEKEKVLFEATKNELLNVLKNDIITEKHIAKFKKGTFEDFIKPRGNESNCGIIFCPYAKTMEISVDKIALFLKDRIPEIAKYIGEYHGQENSGNLEHVQEKFKKNEITLLVATKAFGMGIDKPNIRFTIHLVHPNSIESFYQEAGRAGRDRQNAVNYILHYDYAINSKGETFGKNIHMSFLNNSYKGKEYDKRILNELLDRISFSRLESKSKIEEEISKKCGIELIIKTYPPENPNLLYVKDSLRQNYGTIYLSNNSYSIGQSGTMYGKNDSVSYEEIMRAFTKYFKENNLSKVKIVEALKEKEKNSIKEGLEQTVKSLPLNGTKLISIGLYNDGIDKIVDFIYREFKISINEKDVEKAMNFVSDKIEFADKILYYIGKNKKDIAAEKNGELAEMMYEIRIQQETFRCLYRFSVLGIIEDYTIIYPSFAVALCKHIGDDEIYGNLERYYLRYYPEAYVMSLMKEARDGKKNALRNCIESLVEFTYDNILDKRKKALENISSALKVSVEKKTK